METLITIDQLLELKGYSRSTYYNRRKEILNSRFSKAIIKDGAKTWIDLKIWDQFIRWSSREQFIKRYGLDPVKNKSFV